jgi:hypothetical protein
MRERSFAASRGECGSVSITEVRGCPLVRVVSVIGVPILSVRPAAVRPFPVPLVLRALVGSGVAVPLFVLRSLDGLLDR